MRIIDLNKSTKSSLLEKLLKRSPASFEEQEQKEGRIIKDVKKRGDHALYD